MTTKLLSLVLVLLLVFSCKKDDTTSEQLCGNVICANGTLCVSGTCDCTTGYSGTACDIIATPQKMIIQKLTVIEMPPTDTFDETWDPNGNPDLFYKVILNNMVIYNEARVKANASTSAEHEFAPYQLELTDLNTPHRISLFDKDSAPDDFMGEAEFTPFDGKNFPETITLDNEVDVIIKIEVEYVF